MRTRTLLVTMAGAALIPVLASPALGAPSGTEQFRASLAAVPHDPAADAGSNVTGKARLMAKGNEVNVVLTARGLSENLPHAMHIHGSAQARSECPGPEQAVGGVDDRLIETVDGLDVYGPIAVSFTTSGDTSADSGLALDRMPVANDGGHVTYQRKIEIPADLRQNLDDLHIVIHGEDLDHDGEYGGPITELGAPLEAELPVACGEINRR